MSIPNVLVGNTQGLNSHPNELAVPPGSTSVADNVSFTRDGLPERRNGFKDYSSNLPDFAPEQLLVGSNGTDKYLHLDSGIWYHDGTRWLRKRASFGTALVNPIHAVHVSGHLYVTSGSHVVFDINLSTGARTILAGRFGVSGSTDGTGGAARFSIPSGICTDGAGNLYVADSGNHTIRKIVIATGAVTTLAGTAGATGTTDATGSLARFNSPGAMTYTTGYAYVADATNARVRSIQVGTGIVSTLITGYTSPGGIATDGTNLYVGLLSDNTIRKIVIAPSTPSTFSSDAAINGPTGLHVVGSTLYLANNNDSTIYAFALPSTTPTLVAGSGGDGTVDGIGAAAEFTGPAGIADDGNDLYVCDYGNDAIRKIYLDTSYVTTLDGVPGIDGASAGLPYANNFIVGPE